jgi:N-acetyl-beta-hexosaminidase
MFSNKSLLASVAKPILFFYFFASALSSVAATGIAQSDSIILKQFHFIPYPQKVELKTGTLAITVPPEIIVATGAGIKEKIGKQQLQAFFSRMHSSPGVKPVKVILGSIDKQKYLSRWLSPKEKSTLAKLNSQGYILQINKNQIVIVGRTGQGALYGVQTLLQMLKNAKPGIRLPLLTIEDWPAVANRYVDVTLAWYAYYFGFGYGSQLWTEGP